MNSRLIRYSGMTSLIRYFSFSTVVFLCFSCQGQKPQSEASQVEVRNVGGPCEGCEAVYEYGSRKLSSIDTISGFDNTGEKLVISGTIYENDGVSPASGILLYAYHTNDNGVYPGQDEKTRWGKRHGKHRGWIKTGKDGSYMFYTFRPGAYPSWTEPAHIHLTVKEPNLTEYYIDDIIFQDDPLITEAYKKRLLKRGGDGIGTIAENNGIMTIKRDIILGLNIPDY